MYKAFSLIFMEYCSPLWAASPVSHLSQLDTMETKDFKIIGISHDEAESMDFSTETAEACSYVERVNGEVKGSDSAKRVVLHCSSLWTDSNGSSSNLVTPRSSVFSMSDGTVDNSSGVPYFYVTAFDPAIKDLLVDPVASLSISLAETNYCRQHGFDAQSPLCVRVELAGIIGKVFGSEEEIAKKALFSRHPEMKTWPSSHGYFVAKMNISSISLLDHFGGAVHVDVQDYFHSSS
uniref:protein CREG1-like n=1 Tax=Myxine glutinosa TaxID=7769 RepID=UPI00358F30C1